MGAVHGVVSRRGRCGRVAVRIGRFAVVCAAACLVALVFASARASAAAYIDGISDQSMPSWDQGFGGTFTNFFREVWLPAGHIRYARYVLGWNEVAGGHNGGYQQWCADASSLGLAPGVAPQGLLCADRSRRRVWWCAAVGV